MSESITATAEMLQNSFFRDSTSSVPELGRRSTTTLENKTNIVTTWARHLSEVREAQKLRYQVFAIEMGANFPDILPGYDIDIFDDYCEHLLVRDRKTWEVIGTYRVLTPAQAKLAGKFYSDGEFDLRALQSLRGRLAEIGRSCVHKNYRQGSVILALWKALVLFMTQNRLDDVVGCVSIPMNMQVNNNQIGMGYAAASIWRQMKENHLASRELQVIPRLPLPVEQLDQMLDIEPPALVRGYLRVGAKVLGAPAWDPNFNTADLPMLMRMKDLPERYRKHFLG
jgi:putative hemolysin